MNNKLIFAIFILVILLPMQVNSSIMEEHIKVAQTAMDNTVSSPITQELKGYEDYYHMCQMLVDLSVVYYFSLDSDDGTKLNFFQKLFKIFTFRIGSRYTATHSINSAFRALELAKDNPKLKACAYGIATHHIVDSVSHNEAVPEAIKKTNLWNGLVHSIKEIHDKNLFTNEADRVYSRQILELGYEPEIVNFFEQVYIYDPVLSKVDIPKLMDFFITQLQTTSSKEYRLGFQSFF
ncbi:MAG: hypothetical protein AABY22_34720, partial [Nanoarchaeota archaeon]